MFSGAHEAFTKIDYIPDYKIKTNKFKSIEIIQHMISNNNGIKLALDKRKKMENFKTHFQITYESKRMSQEKLEYFQLKKIKMKHIKICGLQSKQYLYGNL